MTAKPVVPREQANRDIDNTIACYLSEGAEQAALGLRFWPLVHYPHLVFYVERPQHIDVWRVLHGQRDIPAWMQEPETI